MNLTVRPATVADIPAVRSLAIESIVWGVPHTRSIDPHVVQASARAQLEHLEFTLDLRKDFKILVARDEAGDCIAGYIMLDLREVESSTGERQCLIHDLAVRRDYWGRFVVHRLMETAVEVTVSAGLQYLVGEVSASNQRTLGTALKAFGFEIERYQIVKKVEPKSKPLPTATNRDPFQNTPRPTPKK